MQTLLMVWPSSEKCHVKLTTSDTGTDLQVSLEHTQRCTKQFTAIITIAHGLVPSIG